VVIIILLEYMMILVDDDFDELVQRLFDKVIDQFEDFVVVLLLK